MSASSAGNPREAPEGTEVVTDARRRGPSRSSLIAAVPLGYSGSFGTSCPATSVSFPQGSAMGSVVAGPTEQCDLHDPLLVRKNDVALQISRGAIDSELLTASTGDGHGREICVFGLALSRYRRTDSPGSPAGHRSVRAI